MEVTQNPTDEWANILDDAPNQDKFSEFRGEKQENLNDVLDNLKKEDDDTINDLLDGKEEIKVDVKPEIKPEDIVDTLDPKTTEYLNKLFEEGVIAPFEDAEIKTYEDFKDLLQVNIKTQLETVQNNILEAELSSLPPQFQSVMKYGMNGGTDVKSLLESWQNAERVVNIDSSTVEGKKQIVAEYLTSVGYGTQEMIAADIKAMEDLGTLDSKVELYKPILEEMQMQKILMKEQEAKNTQLQEQEFQSNFISAVEGVLTQDKEYIGLELPINIKQALYSQSLPQYVSNISGRNLDALEAIVEEAKYGQNANPAFYTELMFHAAYPEEYKAMLLSQVKAEIVENRERKLRTQVQSDMGKSNHVSQTKSVSIKPIKF